MQKTTLEAPQPVDPQFASTGYGALRESSGWSCSSLRLQVANDTPDLD